MLLPANEIFSLVGDDDSPRRRRRDSVVVQIGEETIHVRDQAPLHAGNVDFSDGWVLEDLVEYLNDHVFFWPGTQARPIAYGVRHFQRYAGSDVVVLVLRTSEVFAANSALGPRFSRFNSGSPRCSAGRGSPRGEDTFVPAAEYHGIPSSVVEVAFRGAVDLTGCTVSERVVDDSA